MCCSRCTARSHCIRFRLSLSANGYKWCRAENIFQRHVIHFCRWLATIWTNCAIRLLHIVSQTKAEPHYTYKSEVWRSNGRQWWWHQQRQPRNIISFQMSDTFLCRPKDVRQPKRPEGRWIKRKRRRSRLDGPGTVTEKRVMLSVRLWMCVCGSVPVCT